MADDRKWSPQVVGECLGAGLCAYALGLLFKRDISVTSFDFWFVPPYALLLLVWSVTGLFMSRQWLSTVVYACCVFVAISHAQTFALRWPGPGTKTRQILDVLQRSTDQGSAGDRRI